jgi:hypothetical protein
LEATVKFEKRLMIDSSPPKAHTSVVALGYADMKITDQEIIGDDEVRGKISLRVIRRPGRILEVFQSVGPRNERYSCFTSSIPFDHGMSGGPIIDVSDERACAIGVISYDLSLDPSGKGCGECAVSSILWPAMGTRMKWEKLDNIISPFLIDFERAGLIQDRGKAHEHIRLVTDERDSSVSDMYWVDELHDKN